MATAKKVQQPIKVNLTDASGMMTQPWAFYFNGVTAQLPPSGSGYVVDGSLGTTGATTIYQGPASSKSGSPHTNDIYFADDTGQIFTASSGAWHLMSPELIGDITKPAFSNTTSLANVFGAPGTYGSSSVVPVITVDAKGRITNVGFAPTEAPPLPGGAGDFIFTDGLGTANASSTYNVDTFTVTRKLAFHQGDATPILVCALPGNTVVAKVELTILTAFDGTSPTVGVNAVETVDTMTGPIYITTTLMATTDNNPTILSNWTVEPGTKYTSPQSVYLSISAGSGSAGYALIVITTVQL